MNVAIFGIPGMGKTFLNDRLTLALLEAYPAMRGIVVRPEGLEDTSLEALEDRVQCFIEPHDAIDFIFRHEIVNAIVSISEIHEVFGYGDAHDKRVRILVTRGRHFGIHVIGDSQRAALTNATLTACSGRAIYSFQQTLAADVERVQMYAVRDVRRIVKELQPTEFYSVKHDRVLTLEEGNR